MERLNPSNSGDPRPKSDVTASASEHVRLRGQRLQNSTRPQEKSNQGTGENTPIILGQDNDPRGRKNVKATVAAHVSLREQRKQLSQQP